MSAADRRVRRLCAALALLSVGLVAAGSVLFPLLGLR